MNGFSFLAKLKSVIPPDSLECFAPIVWRYLARFHSNEEVCHWSPKFAWLEPLAGAKYQLPSHTSRKKKRKKTTLWVPFVQHEKLYKSVTRAKRGERYVSFTQAEWPTAPCEPDPLRRGWNFSASWDWGGDKSSDRAVFHNPLEQWTCSLNLTFGR